MTTDALTTALTTLSTRSDADGVSITQTDTGYEVRLINAPLFVTFDELSERLPGQPTHRVLLRTCQRLGVKVGKVGGKACVSWPAFKRALEADE